MPFMHFKNEKRALELCSEKPTSYIISNTIFTDNVMPNGYSRVKKKNIFKNLIGTEIIYPPNALSVGRDMGIRVFYIFLYGLVIGQQLIKILLILNENVPNVFRLTRINSLKTRFYGKISPYSILK